MRWAVVREAEVKGWRGADDVSVLVSFPMMILRSRSWLSMML
jgi:hypothetical protein